jgi:hypothetical protein
LAPGSVGWREMAWLEAFALSSRAFKPTRLAPLGTDWARPLSSNLPSAMLLPEQEELLVTLVEAARTVPRPQQQFAMYSVGPAMGQTGTTDVIVGDAIQGELPVLQNDVQALVKAKLLEVGTRVWGDSTVPFTVSAKGFAHYEGLRGRSPDPGAAIEEELRRYLDKTVHGEVPRCLRTPNRRRANALAGQAVRRLHHHRSQAARGASAVCDRDDRALSGRRRRS